MDARMRLFTARIIRKSDFSKQKNPVMSSSREVHFISRGKYSATDPTFHPHALRDDCVRG
jgi:hypothetical protein